jgi:hypothetical protein
MAVGAIAFGAGAVERQRSGDIGGRAMAQENLFQQNNESLEIEGWLGHFGCSGHLKLQFYY